MSAALELLQVLSEQEVQNSRTLQSLVQATISCLPVRLPTTPGWYTFVKFGHLKAMARLWKSLSQRAKTEQRLAVQS